MADTDKETLKKLGKLVEAFREHHTKGAELLEEMMKLLAGGPGIAATLKRLEKSFEATWGARYPGRYVWNYAIDRAQMKRLLAAKLSPEEIERRMINYVADSDPFYVQHRHEFRLFASQNNRFADIGVAPEFELDGAPPADCTHTPRCQSDVEHTKRRNLDRPRGGC